MSGGHSNCYQNCKNTNGCTAYAYYEWNEQNDYYYEYGSIENCYKYGGGPYTYGDDRSGFTCYVMPGIHISCCICKNKFCERIL